MNLPSILIVEDESIVALDMQGRLKRLGYTVVGIASRGEEAVRKAVGSHPDLVLMDIRLKGEMDGIEAAHQIRAKLGTPVIYLTAYASEATLQRAKITGPSGYLLKPFEERELHATIEMALYKHQTEQALKNYAAELAHKNRQLALINRLVTTSSQGAEPKAVLEEACCELSAILRLPHAFTLSFNESGGTVTAYQVERQEPILTHELTSQGVVAFKQLLAQKKPVMASDAQSDPRVSPLHGLLGDLGTTSLLLLPLVVDEGLVGGLDLAAVDEHHFSEALIHLAWEVVEQLSSVLTRIWLDEERQRLSAALEQTDSNVLITDTEGLILYVNPAFEYATGFHRADVIGKTSRILKSDMHDAAFYEEMWATISADKVWRGHIVNKKSDGSLYTAEATIIPVHNGADSIVSYVSVQRDVTRELEVEEQYQRGRPQEFQVLGLRTMMSEMKGLLEGVVNGTIAIETEASPDLWSIRADPTQLERVIVNLAANARDAMPDGGTLKLGASNLVASAADVAFDPEVHPGEYVVLSVCDTGVGMSEEVRAHLFEPFFTTKVEGEGTGLGLATVYGIVKQSGGMIRVRSVLGRGTTFELLFPRFGRISVARSTRGTSLSSYERYQGIDREIYYAPPPPAVSLRIKPNN